MTSLVELIEKQYGKRGTKKREEYEEGFEAFKLSVMLQELRKEQGLTQEQLADKCGLLMFPTSQILKLLEELNKLCEHGLFEHLAR